MSSQTKTTIFLVVFFLLLLSSNNGVQSSKEHKEFPHSSRSEINPQDTHKDHDHRSKIRKQYQTSDATSTLMQDTKSITIDSFPDEIFIKIFFYLKFSYIRQVLSRVGKRWNELAYSEILYPTCLKLVYDFHIPATAKKYKKRELIHNPTQAINFNAFKTLEIEIVGDMTSYDDLFNLVQNRAEKFEKLENLIIKMDWTSSNDKTLNLLTQLLKKNEALKTFSLIWVGQYDESDYEHVKFAKDDYQHNFKFWKELKNSKAKDITIEMNTDYYDDSRAEKALLNKPSNELRFYSYLFENTKSSELNNLRKLAFNVPPSKKTYVILKNAIEKSCHSIEEINIDFYYFVHWMKEKENLLEVILNCKNLRKLIINFPTILEKRWNEETGGNLEPHIWQEIVDTVGSRRTDIFLQLKTNVGFLRIYNFLEISNNERGLKIWKSLKSLILIVEDPFTEDIFRISVILNEIAVVFEKCPELEKLEITYDVSGDEDELDDFSLVDFIFQSASKLKILKELAIAYTLPEARIDDTYLINLVERMEKINKITVTVTSSEFLENCAYVCDRGESYFDPNIFDEELDEQKKAIFSIYRDSFVGEYILNESDKEKLRNSLQGLFEIDSEFHTRFRKNDSHRLILTRK